MRSARLLAALSLAIASGAIAQKQTEAETGSNIPIPRRARFSEAAGVSQVDRGRIAMADFARCTVDRQATRVTKLIALPADGVDSSGLRALADDECLASGSMQFRPMLLRGALFVELYRRRADAMTRNVAWQMPVVPFDGTGQTATDGSDRTVQIGLLMFAQCVVERDAAAAKAVVLARTASPAQDTAFAALAPSLGPCLPTGQKITLGKTILEGALGEILYRGAVPMVTPATQEAK